MSTEERATGSRVTEADVAHIAALARLELRPSETAKMAAELSAILGYFERLAELDTSGAEPDGEALLPKLPLRPDEPRPSLGQGAALAEAPRAEHAGFVVPSFVDE